MCPPSDAVAVWVGSRTGAACDSEGMTIVGSDDATEEGSVSVVPVTGATVDGPGTCRYGGVGIPVNSLNETPRLLDTVVSGTNSEGVSSGVKPVCSGVNCGASSDIAKY